MLNGEAGRGQPRLVRCSVDGCEKRPSWGHFCEGHYSRLRKFGDVQAHKPLKARTRNLGMPCSVEGCGRPAFSRRLCRAHYQRWFNHGDGFDRSPAKNGVALVGSRRIRTDGYIEVKRAGSRRWRIEHRAVMEDVLGRALHKDESVHHRNGNRADNRIENLELWSRYQPSGQRVQDKVAWAREIIARYGDLVERMAVKS